MSARKRRISVRRCIALIVFACGLLVAGICVAKMITVNPITKDSGLQVAGWSVDVASSDSSNMTLDAGRSAQTYSLVVTNDSEVVSEYGIKVSNIPAGVKIGLDISSASDLQTPVNGEILFTNTGGDLDFDAPNNTRTHTLSLVAEATANATQSAVDMTIEVQFAQKDPRL